MDEPRPNIKFIGFAPLYHIYKIDNWEDYEKYPKSEAWEQANSEASYLGLNESDRLKLIAARLLEENDRLFETIKQLRNASKL